MLNFIFSKFFNNLQINNLFCDVPTNKQMFFQDPASPVMEGLIELHDFIFSFIVVIFFVVFFNIYKIIYDFNFENYKNIENIKKHVKLINFSHGVILEIVWTTIPSIILVFIAIPSFSLLYSMDEVIEPSLTVKVIGHQWYWSYEYSDRANKHNLSLDSYLLVDSNIEKALKLLKVKAYRMLDVNFPLVLPIKTHIRFLVTSADVIHSWAIPSLALKIDAMPGRLNQLSTYIKRSGIYYGQCSEICGVNHGYMPSVIFAVSKTKYINWLLSHDDNE